VAKRRPIATYTQQGCRKKGIKPKQHGIIHTPGQTPRLLQGEPELGVTPIRLVMNRDLQGVEKLAKQSRINYSKHVTIEHNSSVFFIGHVHPDDLAILESGVDEFWEERRRARHKHKKQHGKK
jgi:hypothetical protein